MSTSKTSPNRLLKEKSPYLLQHAYNPVDWYPWGQEAFDRAKAENKPILVSIGYSTCHWCHVMERESYEDAEVAAIMNRDLINIKVDREERPDVDKIYMTAVSAMTGQGGWPLNVFLTPDLKPIYGGTYFPPQSRWGHPAWKDVVLEIGRTWRQSDDHEKMQEAATRIAESLKRYVEVSSDPVTGDPSWLDHAFKALKAQFDSAHGGFGPAPKFPMPVYHTFLLRNGVRTRKSDRPQSEESLAMSLHTLRAMAQGGIYDHLGGGFSRYSTDARWHVPHFEKMLYDNAQLAVNFLEAFQVTQADDLRTVARETLAYMRRDLAHPEGGFYSAEDADSHAHAGDSEKKEGAFYVWGQSELQSLLGAEQEKLFSYHFGVQESGNAAQDPHGEFTGKNILFQAHLVSDTAREFHLTEDQTKQTLANLKARLFKHRAERPRPHLDDKIITAWNGLAISAFAKAFHVLGDQGDLETAQKAARFVKEHLYESSTRHLYRRWRDGEHGHSGIADDYAFLIQGLIDLYEADFNSDWLVWSVELMDEMMKRFYDSEQGGFFMTAKDQDVHLLFRVKEDMDNVEPSASSVAVVNLLRLYHYTQRSDFQAAAEKTLRCFGATLRDSPRALPFMLAGLMYSLTEPTQIVLVGKRDAADVQALRSIVRNHFIPNAVPFFVDTATPDLFLERSLDFLKSIKPLQGKATAYVCVRHACQNPTTDPREFDQRLQEVSS